MYKALPQNKYNTLARISLKHVGNLVTKALGFSKYIACRARSSSL
jgi:hypothetical protein